MLHTYTFVPDVAQAMVTLGEADSALGQIWHVPNAATITTRQYIEQIFAEIGKPAKVSAAPEAILWLMGLFDPTIKAVYEMVYQYEEPFVLDHSKFVRAFGNIATPIKAVIKPTVAWYRANPKPSIAQRSIDTRAVTGLIVRDTGTAHQPLGFH